MGLTAAMSAVTAAKMMSSVRYKSNNFEKDGETNVSVVPSFCDCAFLVQIV